MSEYFIGPILCKSCGYLLHFICTCDACGDGETCTDCLRKAVTALVGLTSPNTCTEGLRGNARPRRVKWSRLRTLYKSLEVPFSEQVERISEATL